MHFRHFLLTALMVGAALILPNAVFAENNGSNGEINSQKDLAQVDKAIEKSANAAAIKDDVTEKAQQVHSTVKPVTPEQASKNQSAEKAQAVGNNVKQAVSQQQPVVTPKTLPSQANGNGYGLSDAKKSEKTENVPGQEKSSTVQASERELDKNTSTTPDAAELSEADMVKDKIESTGLRNPSKLEGQGPDVAIPSKVEHVVPLVPKLPQKGGIPAGKEETPTIDQVINPTPRSNGSGGQSNDRVSQGFQTISNLDKWFEWNKFYDMKLIQFYHSHNAIKNHQWVNAPPSPPPQAAPFLKTVTRS